jgi:hypothetical protein
MPYDTTHGNLMSSVAMPIFQTLTQCSEKAKISLGTPKDTTLENGRRASER